MTDFTRLRTPFVNMSFTPDVPSNALGPNEYNSGLNVEADVRGIKKVSGEQSMAKPKQLLTTNAVRLGLLSLRR